MLISLRSPTVWWVASLLLLSLLFFVIAFQHFDYNVPGYGFWVCHTWNLLSFLDVRFMSFIKFGKFSTISPNSFFSFFLSFWDYLHDGTFDDVPQVSSALFIFPYSFFLLFFKMDNLNWPGFKFTFSFFCLLKSPFCTPLVNFPFQLLYFSAPEFLFNSFS